jgi:hypothetical protein
VGIIKGEKKAMPKLWEKTGNAKNNSDLVEVDSSKLAIKEPTVVFFPGLLTNDNNTNFASMDLNYIKNLLSGLPKPPKVYLWSHPDLSNEHKLSLSSIFRDAVHNLSAHLLPSPPANDASAFIRYLRYTLTCQHSYTAIAKDQAQKLIMPLVTTPEGKPLRLPLAQRNLHNLTLVAYCIGNLSVQELYNASKKLMEQTGYTARESQKLLQEIALISFASYAEPTKEGHRYTTLSVIQNDDRLLGDRDRFLHPMRKIFAHFNRQLKIKQISDTSVLVTATVMGEWKDRNKKVQDETIAGVRLPAWHKGAFNHFMSDYVNSDDQHSQVSRIVQNALLNAVTRKRSVTPLELLRAPTSLDAATKYSYLRKIQRAMQG